MSEEMQEYAINTPRPKKSRGASPKFRRRQWIVDIVFQGQYIAQLLLVALLVGVVAGCVVLYLILNVAEEGPKTERVVIDLLPRFALESLVVLIIVLPAVSVFLSHRIAGPIYRVRDSIRRVVRGDLSFRVNLRRLDHFKNLARDFNGLMDYLEESRRHTRKMNSQTAGDIQRALDMIKTPGQEQLPEALRILEESAARLRD
jgi:methyl-accepting chemotaxis protein